MLSHRPSPASGRHPRRGDTVKVVIVVLAALFVLFLITCAGVGVLGYVWWQKNFSRMMLTQPEDIRALTAEIADITIPAEFQPAHGMAIFGMKVVTYRWCPTGSCPPLGEGGDDSLLTLSGMSPDEFPEDAEPPEFDEFADDTMSDDVLKDTYVSYTKETREFTIRGQTCKFDFVRGEELDWSEMDNENTPTEDAPVAADNVPATPAESDDSAVPERPKKGTGRILVSVHGRFPGKSGDVTLDFRVPADQYREDKILEMLQSIK